MLAERGFTKPQWRVLRVVNEYAPLVITTLAQYCASVARILKSLEGAGHLKRLRDEENSRRSLISVRQCTREITYVSGTKSAAIRAEVFKQFSEEKRNELADLANELASIRPKEKA